MTNQTECTHKAATENNYCADCDKDLEEKRGHTPGPWEAVEHDQRIGQKLAGRWRIRAKARRAETEQVMQLQFPGEGLATDLIAVLPAMSDANARLIAAAPELLEALDECLDALQYVVDWADHSPDGSPEPSTDQMIAGARKAIKEHEELARKAEEA